MFEFDWHWLLPSKTQEQSYGLLGDYIGGLWGTAISVATLLLIFGTWLNSKASEKRNSVISILSEMMKTHDQIVSSEGRFLTNTGTPALMLRDFSWAYKLSRRIEISDDVWNVEDRINIAYTFAYYGPNSHARQSLSNYGKENIKLLGDEISRMRDRARPSQRVIFSGHQSPLSTYMRNLFSMYKFIDSSDIKRRDKKRLAKVIRSKLTNYEQAILALNVMSNLGQPWEMDGIVDRYKPFANIPRFFFNFDDKFDISERFPHTRFEWQKSDFRKIHRARFRIGWAQISVSFWSLKSQS